MKNSIKLFGLLLTTTTLGSAAPLWAQAPAEAPAADEGEIVVTAQRREERLQDVPLSITALGSGKLEQAQVKSFDDYAKLLPSVSFQSFGPGQSQIFFRGVASGGDGLHVGPLPTSSMYIDEIPVTTIGGTVDMRPYDLSRIEALAGPQGTLFGASSLSGVLRIITNKPDPSKFSGSIDVQANKYGKGDFGGSVDAYVNLPLNEKMALRVTGFYEKLGGYIDNLPGSRTFTLDDNNPATNVTVNNSALVENDYNDIETYGGRAALGIELDDNWTVTPQLIYQHQVAHGGFLFDPKKGDLKVVDYLPGYNKDRWYQASLTIQGKLSDWDISYSGGYFQRKVNNNPDYSYYSVAYDTYTYDSSGTTYYGFATYFPDGNGGFLDPTQNALLFDKYTKFTSELRVSSPTDKPFRITAGLFLQHQSDTIKADYQTQGLGSIPNANALPPQYWVSAFPGTDDAFMTRIKRKDKDYAMFAQVEYDIMPHVTLIGGIRGFMAHNTVYGWSGIYRVSASNLGACKTPAPYVPYKDAPCVNVDKKQDETGVIWKGGVKWQATPDAMFYATVSTGYRPGGNNRRPGVDPFKSDRLYNYELGWKTHFGHVYFNGAAFYEKWKDMQFSLVPFGQNGVTNTYNAGDARIYGVEGDMTAKFGGLSLSVAGTYVDSKLSTDFCEVDPITKNIVCTPGTPPAAAKGTRLPVMPKFKGSASARYEFPLGSKEAFVQAAATHQGGTRSFLPDADFASVGPTKQFTTFDFSAGVHWDKWRLEAFIQNAFDKRGGLSKNTQCATQLCGQYARIYPIKPQFFGLKMGYDF